MEFKKWRNYCMCSLGGVFPQDAVTVDAPFSPLVLLIHRDPMHSRGWYAVSSLEEALQEEGPANLLPLSDGGVQTELNAMISQHGATVLNTAFSRSFDFLAAPKPADGLRVTLVGLGDVGGTLLTALKLLGSSIRELKVYDPNEAQCKRYEMELNQVLPLNASLPEVTVATWDTLFDCDVFLFTASRGVPPVGSAVTDVRLAQYQKNREMLTAYAKLARKCGYMGLFCQISDPVDLLCRTVFLDSNRNDAGTFDGCGLLPEQIQGFGLGVMAARAAYYANQNGVDFAHGRAFGPHGADLIVANHPALYDSEVSARLTQQTVAANLEVRALGFKPYIAPALSSAAVSILKLLRGEVHFGAVPMGGTYFGCRSRMTSNGVQTVREALHPDLFAKICAVHQKLEAFPYD